MPRLAEVPIAVHAATWSAVAALVAAVATVVLAIITWRYVKLTKDLVDAQRTALTTAEKAIDVDRDALKVTSEANDVNREANRIARLQQLDRETPTITISYYETRVSLRQPPQLPLTKIDPDLDSTQNALVEIFFYVMIYSDRPVVLIPQDPGFGRWNEDTYVCHPPRKDHMPGAAFNRVIALENEMSLGYVQGLAGQALHLSMHTRAYRGGALDLHHWDSTFNLLFEPNAQGTLVKNSKPMTYMGDWEQQRDYGPV